MLAGFVRRFWSLGAVSSVFGCALAVSYDGFERTSAGDHDSGTGASSGVSGGGGFGSGTFGGGASGAAGSTGGTSTGGVGGGESGGTGGKGGTGGVGGACVEGTACSPATCSNSIYITYLCQNGSCGMQQTECTPYQCGASGCKTSCSGSGQADCVPGYKCNLGECSHCITCAEKYGLPSLSADFCLNDSQGLWTQLVSCCESYCKNVCEDAFGNALEICGGTASEIVGMSCQTCLNTTGCGGHLQNCMNDLVD